MMHIVMVIFVVHVYGLILIVVGCGREGFVVGVDRCGFQGDAGGAREDAFTAEINDSVDGHGGCEAEEETGGKEVRFVGRRRVLLNLGIPTR